MMYCVLVSLTGKSSLQQCFSLVFTYSVLRIRTLVIICDHHLLMSDLIHQRSSKIRRHNIIHHHHTQSSVSYLGRMTTCRGDAGDCMRMHGECELGSPSLRSPYMVESTYGVTECATNQMGNYITDKGFKQKVGVTYHLQYHCHSIPMRYVYFQLAIFEDPHDLYATITR